LRSRVGAWENKSDSARRAVGDGNQWEYSAVSGITPSLCFHQHIQKTIELIADYKAAFPYLFAMMAADLHARNYGSERVRLLDERTCTRRRPVV
jgi:hypothetical protein